MSVMADKWIKRMAQNHEMIVPFSANQMRQAEGNKIISYGLSSYLIYVKNNLLSAR